MAEFERAGGVGEGSFAGRDVKFDTADISGFSAAEIRSLPEGLSSMPVDIQRHIQRFNELGSGGAEIPDTDVLQANKKALSDLGGEISKQISEADGFGTLDPKSVQPLFDKLNELNEAYAKLIGPRAAVEEMVHDEFSAPASPTAVPALSHDSGDAFAVAAVPEADAEDVFEERVDEVSGAMAADVGAVAGRAVAAEPERTEAEHTAATKLQALVRGELARAEVANMRDERDIAESGAAMEAMLDRYAAAGSDIINLAVPEAKVFSEKIKDAGEAIKMLLEPGGMDFDTSQVEANLQKLHDSIKARWSVLKKFDADPAHEFNITPDLRAAFEGHMENNAAAVKKFDKARKSGADTRAEAAVAAASAELQSRREKASLLGRMAERIQRAWRRVSGGEAAVEEEVTAVATSKARKLTSEELEAKAGWDRDIAGMMEMAKAANATEAETRAELTDVKEMLQVARTPRRGDEARDRFRNKALGEFLAESEDDLDKFSEDPERFQTWYSGRNTLLENKLKEFEKAGVVLTEDNNKAIEAYNARHIFFMASF